MSNNRFRPSNSRFKQQSESRFDSICLQIQDETDDQPREQRNHHNNGGGSWKNTNHRFEEKDHHL